jgi:hypothetical protein
MITFGTGGAMEPQVSTCAGTGWKACATVIFAAETRQSPGTPGPNRQTGKEAFSAPCHY